MKGREVVKNLVRTSSHFQNFVGAKTPVDVIESANFQNVLPYEAIPGPKPIPILGNNWRFIPYIGDFQIQHIDKVAKKLHEKYGKIVKIEGLLGRPDMVFLFDPDDIEKVFRTEDAMPFRPSMPSLNYYKHVLNNDFFGDLGGVIAVISTLRNERMEVPDTFLNEIHKWSLESLANIALDVRLGCLDATPQEDTQRLIDAINTFFLNVPILELKIPFWRIFNTPTLKDYISSLDTIKEICLSYVEKAQSQIKSDDGNDQNFSILQKVLNKEKNIKLATILALDMFLVGVDTTSNAVASILYQLATDPEKQQLLHKEVDKVLEDKTAFNSEVLDEMVYLKACIKETLRMFPVVIGNGRQTSTDCILRGYHIPKGVQMIFQHYVISNQEEYFTRSNEFIPERWLKSCPYSKEHHPFASLPFGFGKRMCLGKRFAELEMQTLIAKIISNYRIEYHYSKLDYYIHPMYTPNGPLKLRFLNKK